MLPPIGGEETLHDDNAIVVGLKVYTKAGVPVVMIGRVRGAQAREGEPGRMGMGERYG